METLVPFDVKYQTICTTIILYVVHNVT